MIDPRLKDAVVVCSVSGGKDSAALSLYLTELGIEHRRVFADTGWENESGSCGRNRGFGDERAFRIFLISSSS